MVLLIAPLVAAATTFQQLLSFGSVLVGPKNVSTEQGGAG
jgi:hypothetical protein